MTLAYIELQLIFLISLTLSIDLYTKSDPRSLSLLTTNHLTLDLHFLLYIALKSAI